MTWTDLYLSIALSLGFLTLGTAIMGVALVLNMLSKQVDDLSEKHRRLSLMTDLIRDSVSFKHLELKK